MANGQAICRSAELLSCAKTALRLARHCQQEQEQEQEQHSVAYKTKANLLAIDPAVSPDDLFLWQPLHQQSSSMAASDPQLLFPSNQESASTLLLEELQYLSGPERSIREVSHILRSIDMTVAELQSLVRRRGHTNDPTEDIGQCMTRFQSFTKDVLLLAESIKLAREGDDYGCDDNNGNKDRSTRSAAVRKGRQYYRHYELIATDIQTMAKERTTKFQEALAARSEVLKMQARRRKLLSQKTPSTDATSTINGEHITTIDGAIGTTTNGGGIANLTKKNINSTFSSTAQSSTLGAVSQLDSPLFTMTAAGRRRVPGMGRGGPLMATAANGSNSSFPLPSSFESSANGNATSSQKLNCLPHHLNHQRGAATVGCRDTDHVSETSPYHGQNGVGATSDGYGDGGAGTGGMRRRPGHQYQMTGGSGGGYGNASNNNRQAAALSSPYLNYYNQQQHQDGNDEQAQQQPAQKTQQQIHESRRHVRESKQRLNNARQAERAIAELGVMFGKMATLITTQSETITNIEDDVEASLIDITSGANEITKLYDITKGNRSLIIKVFGILILFILFFRLY